MQNKIRLNVKLDEEKDKEIIEWLTVQENKSASIKSLIFWAKSQYGNIDFIKAKLQDT
jgi:hypothetical protein